MPDVPNKPLAILTDDTFKAIRDMVAEHRESVVSFSTARRDLRLKDGKCFIFCDHEDQLRGWVITGFRTMIYKPTDRESKRNMAAMLIVAPTRVR